MATFTIRCRECFGKFKVQSLDEVPADCPLCGAFINSEKRDEVAMPALFLHGGARTRSIDKVYRDAEAASEVRIEEAAAMTPGAQRSDFSELKVTDFRSNMVEGETAVAIPQTSQEFQRHVSNLKSAGQQMTPNGGMVLTGQAQAYSAQTRTGPEPNAGARAMSRLRTIHASKVDPRMNGAVSSLPALETTQPGYQSRT